MTDSDSQSVRETTPRRLVAVSDELVYQRQLEEVERQISEDTCIAHGVFCCRECFELPEFGRPRPRR